MPHHTLTKTILLPELKLQKIEYWSSRTNTYHVEKTSNMEICPKCATPSKSGYDHRFVKIKDHPLRGKLVVLKIRKRRFWCAKCSLPFTEPVPGVMKGFRTTQRYRKGVMWACERFSDLKSVSVAFACSYSVLYKIFYEQLELKLRKRQYAWPKTIGIDEHSFRRNKQWGRMEFASIFVDYKKKRIFEVVDGKAGADLRDGLAHIEGRNNVQNAVVDLAESYKSFVKSYFPNARIIADKFHVLRLLTPSINRRRKEITGDKRTNPIRKLLLRNGHKLKWHQRRAISDWLEDHPDLKEVYSYKEAMHRLYRTKGYWKASNALTRLTDSMARSVLPEIKRLRRTLLRWRKEILAYFETGLTNGRTEGFNGKAKLVKKKAYGYKSFENYRLRLLTSCA